MDRIELKMRGKQAFCKNYWLCVLVGVILLILINNGNNRNNQNNQNHENHQEHSISITNSQIFHDMEEFSEENQRAVNTVKSTAGRMSIGFGPIKWVLGIISTGFELALGLGIFVGFILISVLILYPLEVGCRRFYYINLYRKASLQEMLFTFRNGWGNASMILFLRDVKLLLWTLLFIIPGIIKSYEYRMVPYLLAENPKMDATAVFAESKRLMDGMKMDAFILDLSFIGWHILGAFTAGIGSILWTNPYVYSTDAALYEALKER